MGALSNFSLGSMATIEYNGHKLNGIVDNFQIESDLDGKHTATVDLNLDLLGANHPNCIATYMPENIERKEFNVSTKAVKLIREKKLDSEEALLRKHGFRNAEGWTGDAVNVLDEMLLDDNRKRLVKLAQELDKIKEDEED